jgi:hypothetical protein
MSHEDNDKAKEALTEEEEHLLEAAKTVMRWNLAHEVTFEVQHNLWSLVMELSKELETKFGNEEIPLFLRANPHKISSLAYCFALLEGAEPGERHIQLAYDWLVRCGLDMELDEFTELWKSENHLKDSEYEMLTGKLNQKIRDELEGAGGEVKDTTWFNFLSILEKVRKLRWKRLQLPLMLPTKR